MRRSGHNNIPTSDDEVSDEVILKFEEGWMREMMVIWREKIEQMHIIDTGALHASIQGVVARGDITTINHKFLEYGIYQAAGVGRGYEKDNGGNLIFLSEEYREATYLNKQRRVGPAWGSRMTSGEPRKQRDWFYRKYYASLMTLNDVEGRLYGETYMGMLSNVIESLFSPIAKK